MVIIIDDKLLHSKEGQPLRSLSLSRRLMTPNAGMVIWYTFSDPEEAVNARLIGHYEVISGQDIGVTVLDQGG